MRDSTRYLTQTFLAGLFAALPLVATVVVIVWLVQFLYRWLGPGSMFGNVLRRFGLGLTESEVIAYLIGLGIVAVAVFLLGMVVRTSLVHVWRRGVLGVVQRIPVVRNVYDIVHSLVDLLAQRDEEKLKSMQPVWVRFGGQPGESGVRVLGLLSTREPVMMGDQPYHAVIVPTAPVPVGGGLLYVPACQVEPAAIGLDQLTSIYVSMGVTSGQHLAISKPAAAATSAREQAGQADSAQ